LTVETGFHGPKPRSTITKFLFAHLKITSSAALYSFDSYYARVRARFSNTTMISRFGFQSLREFRSYHFLQVLAAKFRDYWIGQLSILWTGQRLAYPAVQKSGAAANSVCPIGYPGTDDRIAGNKTECLFEAVVLLTREPSLDDPIELTLPLDCRQISKIHSDIVCEPVLKLRQCGAVP
jgi:hypothetical protein